MVGDAESAAALWNEHGIRKKGGKFSFSELTALDKASIDAVITARAASLDVPVDGVAAALSGRYSGSKIAREVLFSVERDCLGYRSLWCVCSACCERDWGNCLLREYTKGEPRWFSSTPAVVVDVAAASLVEETEAAAAARVRVGDIVARTHTDALFPNFHYYLMRVTERAHVLDADRTDSYGKTKKKNAVVIVGHLLEPENDEFGAGPHHIYTEWECVMLADELITHHITNEPKIVLLPTINAGEEDYVMLDEQTHDGIMKTIEGHV